MLSAVVVDVQEAQIPLLSAMLLGGSAAKVSRMLRVGTVDAGLGPTALFPMHLRRPVAILMNAAELGCGIALVVTAGRLGRGEPANAVRLATALLFLVATSALIELRASYPDAGCGCFGDLSKSPVSGRTLARAALFAAAALATIGLPPLHPPHPGAEEYRMLGILVAELVVIAALSPEIGEALVRLGYSEPCELRRLPAVRTLTALRRSSQWRKRAGVITSEMPVDMWRELCWRYVVFPARVGDRAAEVVFAVFVRPHRPMIHAALVDPVTGEVLSWPTPSPRRRAPGWEGRQQPAKAPRRDPRPAPDRDFRPARARDPRPAPDRDFRPARARDPRPAPGPSPAPDLVGPGMLAAPTDPGRGIPPIPPPPAPRPGSDLPLSSDL
jgi:hypothetical protein